MLKICITPLLVICSLHVPKIAVHNYTPKYSTATLKFIKNQ